MTLGELRKLTAGLPDGTVFVNENGVEVDYDIEISREYGRACDNCPLEVINSKVFLGGI